MENTEINEFSNPRIECVDKIRGLMIIYVIFIHGLGRWTNSQHDWMYGLVWLFTDFMGASIFVFISGIGLSLFYIMKKNKIKSDQNYTRGHARVSYIIRTAWLFLFSVIANVLTGFGIFFWMIMQTLSFGRIFAYPFLQTSIKFKVFMGLIFIFLSEPLHILLEGIEFIYNFFFLELHWNTPFPFFFFLFFGMAIGDWIYSWRINSKINTHFTLKPS
ncbi:MAG: DUF1624 domain-containing protein [archaeon]|nr:DUF1624 domain-containing protein [archaeon]